MPWEGFLNGRDVMDKVKVKKWTNHNGNKCFRFLEREVFERPWIIILIAILLVAITGAEYIVYGSCYSFVPNRSLFLFAFLWWTTIPLKSNEAVIEKTVHELMDEMVDADAKAAGTEVIKSSVHYDTRGTYAIITGRCFLVLLKNGVVWEYPFVYHSPTNDHEGFYECGRNYTICRNEFHIRAIHPQRWHRFVSKFKMSDKTQLGVLIVIILAIGCLVFGLFCWMIYVLKWWSLVILIGFSMVWGALEWVARIMPNQKGRAIEKMVLYFRAIVYCLVSMAHPFITIVGTYFFVFIYAFAVPAIGLIAMKGICNWNILSETIVFLAISFGSILCSHSYSITKWLIHQTPLRNWGNHQYEYYREELAVYLIHPSNVIFLLYLMYFVFLGISGFLQIQSGDYLISEKYDTAIFKAFLVYIAFTNMRLKAKDAEIDAKELLKRTLQLFIHDKCKP